MIAPHGAMSVLASYLNKSVIDIFDTNVKSNSFHEFKPQNFNYKTIFTSDLGNFSYHNKFLSTFSNLNFDNKVSNLNFESKIHYFHNINTQDLFKLIDLSNVVISPHGAMTVLASYLNKNVIDIFDTNITSNSFHEFKPKNLNYKFLILTNDKNKVKNKILNNLTEFNF